MGKNVEQNNGGLPKPIGGRWVLPGESMVVDERQSGSAPVDLCFRRTVGGGVQAVAADTGEAFGLLPAEKAAAAEAMAAGRWRRPVGRNFVILGDSTSASGYVESASTVRYTNYGWWVYAMALLGWPGRIAAVGAVGGLTTAQINDLWDTLLLPEVVDEVWGLIGQNDIGNAIANVDAALADLDELAAKVRATGAVLRLSTVTPRTSASMTAAVKAGLSRYNAGLRARARRGEFWLWDAHNALLDSADVNGALRNGVTYDDKHPNPYGSYLIGRAFATTFAQHFASAERMGAGISNADTRLLVADSPICVANPRCTGSGGTANNGGTGTTATSWVLNRNTGGNLTVAGSQVTDTDELARVWQRLTFGGTIPASTEDMVRFQQTVALSSLVGESIIGRKMIGRATWRSNALSSNIKCVRMSVDCLNSVPVSLMSAQTLTDSTLTSGFFPTEEMRLETPEFIVPDGTVTLRVSVFVTFVSGIASGTLDVCDVWPELIG